jgi:hypothetical protein
MPRQQRCELVCGAAQLQLSAKIAEREGLNQYESDQELPRAMKELLYLCQQCPANRKATVGSRHNG